MSRLIFFDHLNFQIVKVNAFYKIVLCKPYLAVTLKVGYGFVQPHGPSQVKLAAYFIQCMEDLVGPGVGAAVFDAGVLQHMIVFKSSCP